MTTVTKIITIIAVLTVTIFFIYLNFGTERNPEQTPPDFPLKNFDGSETSMHKLFGKPIIINFWAEWCFACRDEMPILERILQKHKDELIIIGVHRTETEPKSEGEKFAKELGISYPLFEDTRGIIFEYFGQGLNTLPLTIFLDSSGVPIKKIYGTRKEDIFEELAEEFLKNH